MSYVEEIERISMERADKLVEAASKIVDLRAQVAALEEQARCDRDFIKQYQSQVAALEKDNDDIHELAEHYRVENGRLRGLCMWAAGRLSDAGDTAGQNELILRAGKPQ